MKKEVRVMLKMTNETTISRNDSLTASLLKMKKKNWANQIKQRTADNLGKLINVESLEKATNSIVKNGLTKVIWGRSKGSKHKLGQQSWSQ